LVILAACGTLRGNAEHIEGVPTIARAFLAAGARSVVGTLWDIPDQASARFFAEFHRQLRADGDPAEALAKTQRAFLTSNDRAHPSAWAAAEVFGAN
jgi:CHAT domain-containing protein